MKPDREFQTLVERYVDGQATAEQVAALSERLRRDAAARQWFIELLNLDSALAAVALGSIAGMDDSDASPQTPIEITAADSTPSPTTTPSTSPAPAPMPESGSASTMFFRLLAMATCVMALVGGAWWWKASTSDFATVRGGVGVEGLADGRGLRDEWHEFDAGAVELVTANGARVVIEAPARFRFESAQRLHLIEGRLAADVPPTAKGFTVITPTGKATDLGTTFGVDIQQQGEAEIHVFEGEVIAQSAGGGQRRSLRDGEAFLLQNGAGASRRLRTAAFIRPEEVGSMHAGLKAGQHARSAAALAKLRQDPALIALLDFESRELTEGSFGIAQGRWPGSRAPEFANVGDHMKLDVGGSREWPQLTLAAWVRLDRLGETFQSLLHTDDWNENKPGQVHWMVTRHTTMRLALFGNTLAPNSEEREDFPDSRTSVLPEQGRWMHLAVVYDSARRTVRFYLNGAFDKQTHQATAHTARLGAAQIGNWDRQDRKLSGRIDELVVLGRAMSDEEVRLLFDAGTPYR